MENFIRTPKKASGNLTDAEKEKMKAVVNKWTKIAFRNHPIEKNKIVPANETFLVEGKAILETKNHTSLEIEEDCLITCQMVYNPFEKMYSKSQD